MGIMVKVEIEFRNRQIPSDIYEHAAVDVGPGLFIVKSETNILAVYPHDVIHKVTYPNGASRIEVL